MKWLKRQWEKFLEKSLWGKFWDILFVVVIVLFLIPDGRVFMQRMILKTGLLGSTENNQSDALDSAALNWKLVDLNGEVFTLGMLNEKSIFLNFWATWCPPCKAEMPSILELYYATQNKANFILISHEDPEKVRAFLKVQNWNLPVYFPLENTPEQLQAASLPTTFVIDKSGTIIHKSEGMRDWSSKEAVLLVSGTE